MYFFTDVEQAGGHEVLTDWIHVTQARSSCKSCILRFSGFSYLEVTGTGSLEIPCRGWSGNYNPQQAKGKNRVIRSWNQVTNIA